MKRLGITLTLLFLCICAIFLVLMPQKNEFLENDVYEEILQRGYIRVGINTNSKPFGYYDKNNNIVGFDADLARYIAQYILNNRTKVEFVSVNPSNRLIMASTGKVDMVISTVTITPSRQDIVTFSIPYNSAGQVIMVKTSSKIQALSNLAGENVGVIFGTTAEKNMRNLVPTANLIGFKTYDDAYKALKLNQINAITSDDTILRQYAIDDTSVKILPKKYSYEPYGIAFKRGKSTIKLKEVLDQSIKDMKRKNILAKLKKQYGV